MTKTAENKNKKRETMDELPEDITFQLLPVDETGDCVMATNDRGRLFVGEIPIGLIAAMSLEQIRQEALRILRERGLTSKDKDYRDAYMNPSDARSTVLAAWAENNFSLIRLRSKTRWQIKTK